MNTHNHDAVSAQPVDTLLAQYAAGHLPQSLHALVAAHLTLSPRNRAYVAALEEAAARSLQQVEPVALKDRDRRLAEIFGGEDGTGGIRVQPDDDALLPAPLAKLIGVRAEEIRWRWQLPGVKRFALSDRSGCEAELLWIRAGRRMPSHTHDGAEYTLVLKGGFSDAGGHYKRGDIAIADQDIDHRPTADAGEDCICFAVTDAPLRLTGPVGRIFGRLFGR